MNVQDIVRKFGLPELPELVDACDTTGNTRELVIYRRDGENIPLGYVTEEDAHYYCGLEYTRGSDWFVGFRRIV